MNESDCRFSAPESYISKTSGPKTSKFDQELKTEFPQTTNLLLA